MLAERVIEWTQQWKEEGLRAGREQGFKPGRQDGRQEGLLQEARAMVLEAVAAHCGAAPDDIAAAVQQIDNRERLHALLHRAVTCPTVEIFREALGTPG